MSADEIEELVDGRPKPFEVSTMSADEIEEIVDEDLNHLK